MIFGPWMNSQDEIDFIEDKVTITSEGVAEHTQWKLISSGVKKRIIPVSSKDKMYTTKFPNLSYFFLIERHSSMVFKVIGGKLKIIELTFRVELEFKNIKTLKIRQSPYPR